MNLRYFKLTDTLDELKQKRNVLVRQYHPDLNKNSKATEITQQINIEYAYVVENRKEEPKQEPAPDNTFIKNVAHSIFRALTNASGVNYFALTETFFALTDEQYKHIAKTYFNEYGVRLVDHIEIRVKDKRTKETLLFCVNTASGNIGVIDLFRFFRNL